MQYLFILNLDKSFTVNNSEKNSNPNLEWPLLCLVNRTNTKVINIVVIQIMLSLMNCFNWIFLLYVEYNKMIINIGNNLILFILSNEDIRLCNVVVILNETSLPCRALCIDPGEMTSNATPI